MSANIVKILAESKNFAKNIRDATTNEIPMCWRGSDLEIRLALTDNGKFLTRDEVGLLIVEIKYENAKASDAALCRWTGGAAACFDGVFSASEWAAGSWLFRVVFDSSLLWMAAGNYRLIVRHESPSGIRNTYLSTALKIIEDASESPSLASPPPSPPEYYTKAEMNSIVTDLSAAKFGSENHHRAAFVSVDGSDTLGLLGNPDKPFRTINAALAVADRAVLLSDIQLLSPVVLSYSRNATIEIPAAANLTISTYLYHNTSAQPCNLRVIGGGSVLINGADYLANPYNNSGGGWIWIDVGRIEIFGNNGVYNGTCYPQSASTSPKTYMRARLLDFTATSGNLCVAFNFAETQFVIGAGTRLRSRYRTPFVVGSGSGDNAIPKALIENDVLIYCDGSFPVVADAGSTGTIHFHDTKTNSLTPVGNANVSGNITQAHYVRIDMFKIQ